ncbi:hypothetical protein DFR58_12632 [Anaerobacterium chartisolvens]|uniref:Uncharacterized protein n=1 Tax=Anaerobacterium chartisolvens TaxID=1297424 RepID=A0A369APG8_9FIRM|nr:hypothetical protein [Anaerobacterium chartisolvens]RCX11259.1 hypothetical protein DFR58_12632 [Anaerobacterium chartisolvens]
MNDLLLKQLIGLKLKAIDRLIDALPGNAKIRSKNIHQTITKALNEALSEYTSSAGAPEEKAGLKNVSID